jgi:transposase
LFMQREGPRMQAYSPEMRRDVLAASELGATTHEIAFELGVSKAWVRRVKQEYREQGKTAPKSTRDRSREWERHAAWIKAKIEAQPDIYLWELQAAAQHELGWMTCDMTFVRACRALGLTRKKRRGSPPSGSARR